MSTIAVLTPFDQGTAIELASQLWRKRVLPIGDVEYQGRTLHFTKDYNNQLAKAFADRAYDQVSFQLADARNTHTNDPERHRGEIVAMTSEPDGLWITLRPTPEGENVLKSNPKLGVSARIVENYGRSDGQLFPAAVQHVLGTLDPRIPGLGAWQAVEMSNMPATVVDLSTAEFAGKEGTDMPQLDPAKQARLDQLLGLPDDQFSQLLAGGTDPADDLEVSEEDIAEIINSMTPEELAELEAEYSDSQLAGAGTGAGDASLSWEQGAALELANARASQMEIQLAQLTAQHDKDAYENEKRALASESGVPPYITELARPLLYGSGHAIEMSNGQRVDGGQVMRTVLKEFGKLAGLMELDVELGTAMDEPDGGQAGAVAAERDQIVSGAKRMMGF